MRCSRSFPDRRRRAAVARPVPLLLGLLACLLTAVTAVAQGSGGGIGSPGVNLGHRDGLLRGRLEPAEPDLPALRTTAVRRAPAWTGSDDA